MKIWDKMVILRPNGGSKDAIAVSDSKEAARALLNCWPAAQGKSYRRAVVTCSAAVDGRVPQETAQWAFIVAVMEAAIPYEIVDRLDAEIGAVCMKLLGDESIQPRMAKVTGDENSSPAFWWPKRGGELDLPRHA